MADIQSLFKQLLQAVYGKEVRQTIVDAIKQCYYDGKAGSIDLDVREKLVQESSDRKREIDVERKRIDGIIAHPEGSTTEDAELEDIRIDVNGKKHGSAGTSVRAQIGELKETIDDIVKMRANLFDKSAMDILENNYMSQDASQYPIITCKYIPHFEYSVSGYIEIERSKTYTFKVYPDFFGGSRNVLFLFDEDKKYIPLKQGTSNGDYLTFTNTYNAKYIRLNVNNGDIDNMMFVEGNEYPQSYIEYGKYLDESVEIERFDKNVTPRLEEVERKVNLVGTSGIPLFGKTVLFNGDSICYGKVGDDMQDAWAGRIATKNNMTYKNYSIGGGTITENVVLDGKVKYSICGSIDKMYQEYPNADYIIIEGGTNDADLLGYIINGNTSERLGTFDSIDYTGNYDTDTFCGALETIFFKLSKYWKGKRFGYIVAQKMGYSPTNGYTKEKNNRRAYFEIAMQICEKWGIKYLNLWDECALNPSLLTHYDPKKNVGENTKLDSLYRDGQHLTSAGYDYISPIIEAWMKTL